ncbi:MAG: MxaD family protein [Burkholderiales bacterium PBB5]|nr:MAG: MxaD family protein [Burkholderiales bacterium PBB5]
MACVRKEITIQAPADAVWAAVRDVGQVHRRLVPGVLVDARLEGDERVVSFANGLVVRERIVDIDDMQRRLAYAAVGGRTSHHNASIQILDEGDSQCRLVWITDLLPQAMAAPIAALVEQGSRVMKQTLEAGTAGAQ